MWFQPRECQYVKSLMGVARNELNVDDFRLFIWMRTMNTCERDVPVLARNNMLAMLLKTRLLLLKQQEQKEKLKSLGNDVDTAMGGTIRNYVLYPYEQVKDTRTGCVETNANIMLETGEGLDDFLRAELFV